MDVVSRLRASADSFVWQAGVTPLSSPWLLVAVPAAYVCGVFALRRALAGRALPLGPLPALHNAVLMLWSAAMFCGTAHAAWTYTRAEHSAAWLVCLPVGTRVAGRLYWWSYVYFISKASGAPRRWSVQEERCATPPCLKPSASAIAVL